MLVSLGFLTAALAGDAFDDKNLPQFGPAKVLREAPAEACEKAHERHIAWVCPSFVGDLQMNGYFLVYNRKWVALVFTTEVDILTAAAFTVELVSVWGPPARLPDGSMFWDTNGYSLSYEAVEATDHAVQLRLIIAEGQSPKVR